MDFNNCISIHCLTYVLIFNELISAQAVNTSNLSNRFKRMDCRTDSAVAVMRLNNVIDVPITKALCNATTVANLGSIVLAKFITTGLVNPVVRVFLVGCREAAKNNNTVAFAIRATESSFTLNFRYEDSCGRSETFWCTINIKQGSRKEVPVGYGKSMPLIIAILVSVVVIGIFTIAISYCYLQKIYLFRESSSFGSKSSFSTTTKDRYNPVVL